MKRNKPESDRLMRAFHISIIVSLLIAAAIVLFLQDVLDNIDSVVKNDCLFCDVFDMTIIMLLFRLLYEVLAFYVAPYLFYSINRIPKYMYKNLNPMERKAFQQLRKVKGNTIITYGIEEIIKSGDVRRFRQMIQDLKQQAAEHKDMIERSLGKCATDTLLSL